MKAVWKMTGRTIRTFFGRYMALLLIVGLSAGFFAGLKITQDAMVHTGADYLEAQQMYDFRLFSTLGFTDEDVEALQNLSGVRYGEGAISADALMEHQTEQQAMKLLSIPEKVNRPSLTAGRMPESADECLADDEKFDEDDIGTVIRLSGDNAASVSDRLTGETFTIVGLVSSPIYLGLDRGTTDIGSGALYSYLYLPRDSFTGEIYTEVSLTLTETAELYSDAYDELIEAHQKEVTACVDALADARYDTLVGDALASVGLPSDLERTDELKKMLADSGLAEPETYVLTRAENAGYVSFENDTAIVSGIANIFPVFFIVIAMLVCMTTMTRMVDEERTQIGVLKAMGFGNGAIMAKYLLYAGSATVIGWAAGFFVCTWGLPQIFWFAYSSLYDFAPMPYLFSPGLAAATLAVSLIGILGSTWFSCRRELAEVPAALIRPRAAKSGKRILLERVTPLWRRLPFLKKITLRNMFRYKKRLVMMLVGISCCCGLVVTAFGVRDSMIDIGQLQFEDVQQYDMEAAFEPGKAAQLTEQLDTLNGVSAYSLAAVQRVDLLGEESMKSISLMSFPTDSDLSACWNLHSGKKALSAPDPGEAVISSRAADKLSLKAGDTLTIRNADLQEYTVTVCGVFDNYIQNFVFIHPDSYEEFFGAWEANTALLTTDGDSGALAETLTAMDAVTSVAQLSATRANVDNALSCLDYIIWLVVAFSGALAFIVIFNLTNINLAERSREIATVQVLGFYPRETESYVLTENILLSVIASFIGLPLGTLFHRAVMDMIRIDSFAFDIHVQPLSYVLAVVCTILFAVIVDLFMKRQVGRIRMAESLKAVE